MIRKCQGFCKYCIVISSDCKVTNVAPTPTEIATQTLNHLAKVKVFAAIIDNDRIHGAIEKATGTAKSGK